MMLQHRWTRCFNANAVRRSFGVIPLQMPALSPTMTQGNVGTWNKKVGDKISPGESLVLIETDKATVDFESQDEGYLAKIIVQQGANDVQIGTLLGYMVDELEEVAKIDQLAPASAPAPAAAAPSPAPVSTPAAPKPAATGVQATSITPAALFHLNSNNLDPKSILATGPGGRMLKGDVLAAIKNGSAKKLTKTESPKAEKPSSAQSGPKVDVVQPDSGRSTRSFTDIPLTNMRKVIASRLSESKRTIPHAYSTSECTMDDLLALRKMLKGK
jgi:pyruvate dehydrogenase E2 component (dihydrolipoamide acetyltransferase)